MSKKIKVYTKGGDKGKTSLIGGSRVSKASLQVESYGTIDELKSNIALMSEYCDINFLKPVFKQIIIKLFEAESMLACDSKKALEKMPQLQASDVEFLENYIDQMEDELPELKAFILPGGSVFSAQAHVARTICRRAERGYIRYLEEEDGIHHDIILQYLNRLSDYLFVLARYYNFKQNIEDILWV